MSETLPQGWAEATISELSSIDGLMADGDWIESKDQDPNGDVRLIQLADIGDGHFIDKSNRYLTAKRADELRCTYLSSGDVLIARMPDPLGRACIFPKLDKKSVTAVDVCIWRSGVLQIANPKWLMHSINSPKVRSDLNNLSSGTTRKRVSGGNLKAYKIPLPPLAEQERIVAKLEALLTRSTNARNELAAIPKLIDRYKQAVLAAAFRGDLTADWRGTSELVGWEKLKAKDVCEKVQSGGTPKKGFSLVGIPFLKVYNIVNQKIAFEYKPQFVTKNIQDSELKKSKVYPNDVLMNIVGPPLGKVAVIPDNYNEWNINQALTLFRPSNRIISNYIYYFLCSGISVNSVINETKGSAGQTNISLTQCREFIFPVPSIDEQKEIVERIQTAFKAIDAIEAELTQAEALRKRLEQATLAKAFKGELVPQNPNDEPASVLLERIRAEREAQPKSTKGRRGKRE
jgi:type I restriction enzyme S subunit